LYEPGTVVTGDSNFYRYLEERIAAGSLKKAANPLELRSRQLVQNVYEMEQIFHSACPVGRVSRRVARFACSSLADALVYAGKQYAGPFYIYEVAMPDATPAAMALTGLARTIVQSKRPLVDAIAAEYWSPKLMWNYWEYLGSTMTVLTAATRFVPPLELDEGTQLRQKLYDEDVASAGRIEWFVT